MRRRTVRSAGSPSRRPSSSLASSSSRQISTRRLPGQEVTRGSHENEAPGDQGGVATTNKQAHPGNREMACSSRRRLFRLSRRADKWLGAVRISTPRQNSLASAAMSAWPESKRAVDADDKTGGRVSPEATDRFILGPACGSPSNTQGRASAGGLARDLSEALRNERHKECEKSMRSVIRLVAVASRTQALTQRGENAVSFVLVASLQSRFARLPTSTCSAVADRGE